MDFGYFIMLLVVAALLVLIIAMYKRSLIGEDVIHGVGEVLEGIPIEAGSLFGKIVEYSKIAVLTVEQLVKTGKIPQDDESRKTEAMRIVANAAAIDGVDFGKPEAEAASACIEAEVQLLPRNQKPPDEMTENAETAEDVTEAEGEPEISAEEEPGTEADSEVDDEPEAEEIRNAEAAEEPAEEPEPSEPAAAEPEPAEAPKAEELWI